MSRLHLSGLYLYPVKSLRGCAVTAAAVDALGLVGDRRFLVVDGDGRFLTQRTLPRMTLVETRLSEENLVLAAPGQADLAVSRASDAAAVLQRVTIWKHTGLAAEDCGEEAATWLTRFLAVNCRLVRLGREYERFVLKSSARPGDAVNFADSCPFLLIGESSLADLNDRLLVRQEEPVPMNRFRPNLVIAGSAPQAEDTWKSIQIGPIVFRSAGPCARCVVVTTDQATAQRQAEPLRTMAGYRRDASDLSLTNFGVNLIHQVKSGTLRVGDTAIVI